MGSGGGFAKPECHHARDRVCNAFDRSGQWRRSKEVLLDTDVTARGVEDRGEIRLQLGIFSLEHSQKVREGCTLLTEDIEFILVRHASLLGVCGE